jgi:type II secretory pathway pseudopilin PulG
VEGVPQEEPIRDWRARAKDFKRFVTVLIRRLFTEKKSPLYEIVVVVLIVSFLWIFHQGSMFVDNRKSVARLNRDHVVFLGMAIQAYRWSHNTFPPDLGAMICEDKDTRACIPITTADALLDPWGVRYQYRTSTERFWLTSLGADKTEGGSGADRDVYFSGP